MRILMLFNPIAGAGRAEHAAQSTVDALRAAGHDVQLAHTASTVAPDASIVHHLRESDALVIVGGDGAVRWAAAAAADHDVPVWQVPRGTENLFARQFGMTANPDALLRALRKNQTQRVDLCLANGIVFHAMVSIGYDAEVVHDLTARRRGRISRRSYLLPMLRRFANWSPPRLTLRVDDRQLVAPEPGMVVIANSPRYGFAMDPCPNASMTDGLLDVTFFPAASRTQLLGWMIACRRGTHVRSNQLIQARGQRVEVMCRPRSVIQIDGDVPPPPDLDLPKDVAEASTSVDGAISRLVTEVRPSCLPVLLPA